MKPSEKLDMLQELARNCADDQNKRYLINLLAEHAEEGEVTEGLLGWVKVVIAER